MVKILTEGGVSLGFGHIYRCETIYQVFFDIDLIIQIFGECETSRLESYTLANWQEASWVEANIHPTDIVIIDSYYISLALLENIQRRSFHVIVIDDLNRLEYRNCTILNPNNFGDTIVYHNSNTVLGGIMYALTRDIFHAPSDRRISQKVKNIFIMIGGTDLKNLTPQIIQYITRSEMFIDVELHVVVPDVSLYNELPKVHFYENLSGEAIYKLMTSCDFAITAGGQTLNELIKTRTPFACVLVANNQRLNIDGAISKGLGVEFTIEEISNINLLLSYDIRKGFIQAMDLLDTRSSKNGAVLLKEYIGNLND